MTHLAHAARTLAILFWLSTSAYAFLLSVPFVYENFLHSEIVPVLVAFAHWHGVAALVAVPIMALALWPDVAARRALLSSAGLVWTVAIGGAALFMTTPMIRLEPGTTALIVAALALVPVMWLALIDLSLSPWPDSETATNPTGRDAVVVLMAAAVSVVLFVAIGLAFTRSFDALGLALSVAAHTMLFGAVFAAFAAVRAIGDLTSKPAQWESFSAVILTAAIVCSAALLLVVPAVQQRDWASETVVAAFGATLGLVLAARGVRFGHVRHRDGIMLAMGGLMPTWAKSRALLPRLGWSAVVVAVAIAFRAASGSMDWNFAVAKIGAVVVWLLVLATALQWAPARVYLPTAAPFGACAVTLAVYLLLAGRLPFGPVTIEAATAAGDAWAISDPSFRTLRDWLQRPVPEVDGAATGAGVAGAANAVPFFDYLQAHTNIARSTSVSPAPVQFASLGGAPSASRPHVFLFIVDSLRRDYLAPYNDRVQFTPAIQQFAAESTVFERALTRYGATGLSVPSIWSGGMLLHKQYVTPFAPMNALHSLLTHERYARHISMDHIVDVVMPHDDTLVPLDTGRGPANNRLCSTLDELRGRLDAIAASESPVFSYALPQDVHVAVLNREGNAAIDGQNYDGYFAPYASRVRKLDECFGAFIGDLKAKNLYDNSVVILTADHGDALGEEGRWGHAYTIYPEVLQVPLIVHVPTSAQSRFDSRPSALAFTTDITPTLYALLGHQPSSTAPFLGRPLFWPKGTPPPTRPDFGLVASSYGSVYGWLDADGRQMYIADGVALRDFVYELDGTAAGKSKPVSPEARVAGQRAIRGGIQAIADYYKFAPLAH